VVITNVGVGDGADHLLGLSTDGNRAERAIGATGQQSGSQIAGSGAAQSGRVTRQVMALFPCIGRSVVASNVRIGTKAGTGARCLTHRVIARIDRNVTGAIPVIRVGKMGRSVDLQIEKPRIAGGDELFAHLDCPGDLDRNLKSVVASTL
jgi:hypothetical protein